MFSALHPKADIGQRRRDHRPDPNPFADCDAIVCCSGAKVTAKHLASTIHCIDDEIIGWLKRREQP
jgi:hypothetical protein